MDETIEPPKLNGGDTPRIGELSSQAFSDMTSHMLAGLAETVENQFNDVDIKRNTTLARIDELRASIDEAFGKCAKQMEAHRERIRDIAKQVHDRVEKSSAEMIELSKRLHDFSDSIDHAHDTFFK